MFVKLFHFRDFFSFSTSWMKTLLLSLFSLLFFPRKCFAKKWANLNNFKFNAATNNKNTEPRNVTLKHSKVTGAKKLKKLANDSAGNQNAGGGGGVDQDQTIELGITSSIVTTSPEKDKQKSFFLGGIFKKSDGQIQQIVRKWR